jgi:CBS domain-containing protein
VQSISLPEFDWSWSSGPPPQQTINKWREQIRSLTRQWLRAGAPAETWMNAFNQVRTSLIAKVWNHTIPEQHRSGIQYIMLGSTARGEDVFDSDLDFALLMDNHLDQQAIQPHLYQFIQTMAKLGCPPCAGFVMGTNDRWAGTLSNWAKRIESYFSLPKWDKVRYLFIILDSRVLQLEESATEWERMRQSVQERLRLAPYLCWEMAHLGIQNTVALPRRSPGFLGLGHSTIHIKNGLLSPVLHSIRLLSVANQVYELSTKARLRALLECGAIDRNLMQSIDACVQYAWRMRIHISSDTVKKGSSPADEVSLFRMSREEREELTAHVDTAKALERMISRQFRKPR